MTSAANQRDVVKHLRELTQAVRKHLHDLDAEMGSPGNPVDRGKRVAQLANALDLANDRARYFGLGVDYRTDDKAKADV